MKLNECILTDLGSVNRGKSKHRPGNDKSLFGGKYPFIQTGEVKSANFYLNTYSETYNDKGLAQSKLWEEGTLLITIAANIAETAILSIKACFPDSIIGFIPYTNKSDVRFVKYYLDYIKKKLQVISQGTTQDNMSVEKLTSMKLFVPDYINQVKIANILSNYDNLIENNNTRIKLLENMAEELYKEWFVRLRFPNYQNTKIVDGIPDGWEKKKIEDICNVGRGSSPRPICDTRYFENGNIPWLKIADATASFIYIYKTKEYVNDFGASFSRKLPKDSLIIAASGTLGFPMFLATECCIHDGWMYFIDLEDKIKIYFYYSLIFLKDYFNNQSYGAAIQNINTGIVKNSSILIPGNNIINRFNNLVQPIFNEIQTLQLKNQNLKETRDLLLPRLISGKLDIKDMDIV